MSYCPFSYAGNYFSGAIKKVKDGSIARPEGISALLVVKCFSVLGFSSKIIFACIPDSQGFGGINECNKKKLQALDCKIYCGVSHSFNLGPLLFVDFISDLLEWFSNN